VIVIYYITPYSFLWVLILISINYKTNGLEMHTVKSIPTGIVDSDISTLALLLQNKANVSKI